MEKLFSRLSGAAMAAVIAVLSGLGVGSGGLLVIWLTMFDGIDAETARGLNLLFFVFSSSAALLIHLLKRRIKAKLCIFLAFFACIGTLAGTYIGTRIDPLLLKRIFGAMLLISGAYTLIGCISSMTDRKKTMKF